MSHIDNIWSERNRQLVYRKLWIEIARVHHEYGLLTDSEMAQIEEGASTSANLKIINAYERRTRHDLKAALEHFDEQAGRTGKLHLGCTSADIVENAVCIQNRQSAQRIIERLQGLGYVGCASHVQRWLDRYPFRGILGAVGSQQDQIDLIGYQAADDLNRRVANACGFTLISGATGQTQSRTHDFEMVTTLSSLLDGPHRVIAQGYVTMAADTMAQWNEGDVSTSVVRRVALPGIWRTVEQYFETPRQETKT